MAQHITPGSWAFNTPHQAVADIDWLDVTLFLYIASLRFETTAPSLLQCLRNYGEHAVSPIPTPRLPSGFDRETGCGSLEANSEGNFSHRSLTLSLDFTSITPAPQLPDGMGFRKDMRMADVLLFVLEQQMLLLLLATQIAIAEAKAALSPWQRVVFGILRPQAEFQTELEGEEAEMEAEVKRKLANLCFTAVLVAMAVRNLCERSWSLCLVDARGDGDGVPAWNRLVQLACNGVYPSNQRDQYFAYIYAGQYTCPPTDLCPREYSLLHLE